MSALPPEVKELYPWTGKHLAVDGGSLHYLDEGERDSPPLLCLHGNPTWSFYWRAIVDSFADTHRVIVPDHIGCGLSDKPQDWDYRLASHIANVERLVDHLELERVTLVVHDWGGAIGMGVATRRPDLAERFVITNTAAFPSIRIPLSIASVRIPLLGALAVRGANAFARVASFRAVSRPLSKAAKAGLLFPYDSWANRIATLRFVEDIPLGPEHPSFETVRTMAGLLASLRDRPMLLLWGDQDFCFTPQFRREWEERFPEAEVHAWSDVGHYVMEDAPDRVIAAMSLFLGKRPVT